MKKFLIILAAIVLLGGATVAFVSINNTNKEVLNGEENIIEEVVELTEKEVISLAKEWVASNAPTYMHDGSKLNIQQVQLLSPSLYQIIFSFESTSAGYGDRSDSATAQVITEHFITTVVSNTGEVQSAITDEIYDEINNELVEEN
jgi:uncharacterized lipoprotein YajG